METEPEILMVVEKKSKISVEMLVSLIQICDLI